MWNGCLFCGGDASEPDHWQRCDGRQGQAEAAAFDPRLAFGEPTARHTDPPTSHQAAEYAGVRASTNRGRALLELASAPQGLTDFELAERTGLQQTSIGVRRGELLKWGLVENTGLTRPAPSGAAAAVWRITVSGIAVATSLLRDGAA